MKLYGRGLPLVIDTSAWTRQAEPAILGRWRATMEADLLACCPVAALEILGGARDESAFADLDRALASLPQAPVTRAACASALAASRELRGGRRLPASAYLIAAAAAERGFDVLHRDRHFDLLATVLPFESVNLAS